MNDYNDKKNKLLLRGKSNFYQWRELITIYLLKAKGVTSTDGTTNWSNDPDRLLDSTLVICERIKETCL